MRALAAATMPAGFHFANADIHDALPEMSTSPGTTHKMCS
jgi:hypothetical protein